MQIRVTTSICAIFILLTTVACQDRTETGGSEEGGGSPGNDHKNIIGSWLTVKATANGEAWGEGIGIVYTFTEDKNVHIVGHDYEANKTYSLDPTTHPKTLLTYYSEPRGSGIYHLEGDVLRTLESLAEEPLQFDSPYSGKDLWNEFSMKRISAATATEIIEKLEDERLGIKASQP
ncbi:MAG: hypothetical protein HKN32_04230 [Flavobacteriales bacterium]|nr:hypothetical protein [Flavobacteriales bacterium]